MRLIVIVCLAVCSCSWFKSEATTVKADVIDCAKAEETAVTHGSSVLQVALETAAALAATVETGGLSAVLPAIEALIGKYGEPIVACAVMKQLPPATTTPTPAPVATAKPAVVKPGVPELAAAVVAHYGWK